MTSRILYVLLALCRACAQDGAGAPPGCRSSPDVEWKTLAGPAGRAELDRWCLTVGAPAISRADSNPATIRGLAIVSWNTHVGHGNLEDIVKKVRDSNGMGPDAGIVLLVQEAFRYGPAVPRDYPREIKVPKAIGPSHPATDVMGSARKMGMSAVYIPSMRDGAAGQRDRGNAVLSTEPIGDIRALELPFGRQRRVAVLCTIRPRGAPAHAIRFVSLHLDTTAGDRRLQAEALAEHLRSLLVEPLPVIAAGDLNSIWGRRDAAYVALSRTLAEQPCGDRATNVWPLRLDIPFGWWRGRIDYLFSTWSTQQCQTLRNRFGSDHYPLFLWLQL